MRTDATVAPICGDCGGPAPMRAGGFNHGGTVSRFYWHECSLCGTKTRILSSETEDPRWRLPRLGA